MNELKKLMAAAVVLIAAVSCNKVLLPIIPEETEVNGDCYVGSLKVFTYAPMEGALIYIGDQDPEKGTCTIFLPSYSKEGQTIPLIPVREVVMTVSGNRVTYSHGKFDYRSGDVVYHFPSGLQGEAVSAEDGSIALTVEYGIRPGKMPFPLDHHFTGTLHNDL